MLNSLCPGKKATDKREGRDVAVVNRMMTGRHVSRDWWVGSGPAVLWGKRKLLVTRAWGEKRACCVPELAGGASHAAAVAGGQR